MSVLCFVQAPQIPPYASSSSYIVYTVSGRAGGALSLGGRGVTGDVTSRGEPGTCTSLGSARTIVEIPGEHTILSPGRLKRYVRLPRLNSKVAIPNPCSLKGIRPTYVMYQRVLQQ